jgi:hypothetical protein
MLVKLCICDASCWILPTLDPWCLLLGCLGNAQHTCRHKWLWLGKVPDFVFKQQRHTHSNFVHNMHLSGNKSSLRVRAMSLVEKFRSPSQSVAAEKRVRRYIYRSLATVCNLPIRKLATSPLCFELTEDPEQADIIYPSNLCSNRVSCQLVDRRPDILINQFPV